jgi:hypothetical protein
MLSVARGTVRVAMWLALSGGWYRWEEHIVSNRGDRYAVSRFLLFLSGLV